MCRFNAIGICVLYRLRPMRFIASVHGSMFSADTHDSLILDARVLGLILVVVVVTEAIAP